MAFPPSFARLSCFVMRSSSIDTFRCSPCCAPRTALSGVSRDETTPAVDRQRNSLHSSLGGEMMPTFMI